MLEFFGFWEVYNNNENFLAGLRTLDVIGINREIGFTDVAFQTTPFVIDLPPLQHRAGAGERAIWRAHSAMFPCSSQ